MNRSNLYRVIQSFVATESVGPATLRSQGAKGMVRISQTYLSSLNLRRFSTTVAGVFADQLDQATEELRMLFPRGGRNWGSARKPLNIFLRNALYNQFLCQRYGLSKAISFFEVPLDSIVAGQLREMDTQHSLPRWPGVKYLDRETNEIFQTYLATLAAQHRLHRVHLDVYLWQKLGRSLISLRPVGRLPDMKTSGR
jgi:hypothetical protein